jgi:hypothetical protein
MTSGRAGMADATYRRNRADMLARDDLCWLCRHPGAKTADHVISAKWWPRDRWGRLLPGLDDIANLRPAHGTMGPGYGRLNRCPTCGRLCNQKRGARRAPSSVRSRNW